MRYVEYSHRHGVELCKMTNPQVFEELNRILSDLQPFPHGAEKGITVKATLAEELLKHSWIPEKPIHLSDGKKDFLDFAKGGAVIEMEWSRFEMFFRDFFRFMLLYKRKQIDVGIIITYGDIAYERWKGKAKPYKSARASFSKLVDFLSGDYSQIVTVPIWCIGIE